MRTRLIRQRLMRQRTQLISRYHGEIARADELETLEASEPEFVERATERWEALVLSKLGDSDARMLNEVIAAMRRLDDGTYGACTTCGSKIRPARLNAIPEAALCIGCADENRTTRPIEIQRMG